VTVQPPVGLTEAEVTRAESGGREAILEVRKLRTSFFTADGVVHAVDNVSFDVRKG